MPLPLVFTAFTTLRRIYNAVLNGRQSTLGFIFFLVTGVFTFFTSSRFSFKSTASSTSQNSDASDLLPNNADLSTNGPIPEADSPENVAFYLNTGLGGAMTSIPATGVNVSGSADTDVKIPAMSPSPTTPTSPVNATPNAPAYKDRTAIPDMAVINRADPSSSVDHVTEGVASDARPSPVLTLNPSFPSTPVKTSAGQVSPGPEDGSSPGTSTETARAEPARVGSTQPKTNPSADKNPEIKEALKGILEQTKINFHNSLKQAEDLSRSANQDGDASAAPTSAHKMNGLMIATEGLLRDPIQMFQDMIVKLAEARAKEKGGDHEAEVDSAATTPVTIDIPQPLATVILEPTATLANSIIDISGSATPCRFRFVDCSQLIHHNNLHIVEYDDLADLAFAAVSYVWRGVIGPATASMSERGSFAVAGATDGDPISTNILRHIARACLFDNIPLFWLDRLCIIQSNRDDKVWQIQHMYSMYASCRKCYVLPGGTRRLASLDEPTMWIHRGWTLQEAVAPTKCNVVVQWEYPGGTYANPQQRLGTTGSIDEIVPGESAQMPLASLLRACVSRNAEFRVRCSDSWTGRKVDVSIGIFGDTEAGLRHATVLSAAMRPVDEKRDPRGIRKKTALWRSAMMRTSSRPVDMVFSIMGLFGVALDPKAFRADDRLGATIALARAILEQGGSPNWLAMSHSLPRNPLIRSFPSFPRTSVAGAAIYDVGDRKVEAAELMGDVDGWLGTEDILGASMDLQGFLSLTTKSVPVQWTGVFQPQIREPERSYDNQLLQFHTLQGVPPFIVSNDSKVWRMTDSEPGHNGDASPKFYAVVVGRMFTETNSRFFDATALIRAVVMEEYTEGKFCRPENSSWFTFNRLTFKFEGWEDRIFVI